MLQNLRKKSQGFTIIEVMIVLAVAGLIMLIVFLAVPALQRNSRNTSRKNDASLLLAAFSEYSSNNNGQIPSQASMSGTTVTLNRGTASGAATINVTVSQFGTVAVTTTVPGSINNDTIYLITSAKCNGNTPEVGQSSRNYVAYYNIETSGNPTPQCVQS